LTPAFREKINSGSTPTLEIHEDFGRSPLLHSISSTPEMNTDQDWIGPQFVWKLADQVWIGLTKFSLKIWGKIPENLGKICENLREISVNLGKLHKNASKNGA